MDTKESLRITFYHALRYHPLYGPAHTATVRVKQGKLLQDTNCIAGDVFASIFQSYITLGADYKDFVGLFFVDHGYGAGLMADSVAHKVGIFKGLCNRTACRGPNAEYFNHSTQKYYCKHCAGKLNRRNPEALDLYGHKLCTHGLAPEGTDL